MRHRPPAAHSPRRPSSQCSARPFRRHRAASPACPLSRTLCSARYRPSAHRARRPWAADRCSRRWPARQRGPREKQSSQRARWAQTRKWWTASVFSCRSTGSQGRNTGSGPYAPGEWHIDQLHQARLLRIARSPRTAAWLGIPKRRASARSPPNSGSWPNVRSRARWIPKAAHPGTAFAARSAQLEPIRAKTSERRSTWTSS